MKRLTSVSDNGTSDAAITLNAPLKTSNFKHTTSDVSVFL